MYGIVILRNRGRVEFHKVCKYHFLTFTDFIIYLFERLEIESYITHDKSLCFIIKYCILLKCDVIKMFGSLVESEVAGFFVFP